MSPLLLESICVLNGQLKLLSEHQQRVNRALGTASCLSLEQSLAHLELPQDGRNKLRLVYGLDARVHDLTIEPYVVRSLRSLRLLECPELRYEHKWLDRSCITRVVNTISEDDVLFTKGGYLRDSSYANVLLLRDGSWYTPDQPLLAGCKRAHLLKTGQIKSCPIHVSELGYYERISFINAMLDPDELALCCECLVME